MSDSVSQLEAYDCARRHESHTLIGLNINTYWAVITLDFRRLRKTGGHVNVYMVSQKSETANLRPYICQILTDFPNVLLKDSFAYLR